MAYCTQTNIINLELTEKELIQLTDDPGLGSVTTAMVTAAIAKADAEIDAYCQTAYTVPFSTVPAIVLGWSATLAAFNLYRNRTKPTTLIDRYNKVMSTLKDVQAGKFGIPGQTALADTTPESTTDGTSQVFRKNQTDSSGVLVGDAGTMEVW